MAKYTVSGYERIMKKGPMDKTSSKTFTSKKAANAYAKKLEIKLSRSNDKPYSEFTGLTHKVKITSSKKKGKK